ncbi:UNVERIFIED_CONTAM: hypothetical protein FKN15_054691 [Acipenser sinensis]
MQVTDVSRRSPVFLPPPNGNSHRSPGYVPGRIAPVRSPPPPKTKPSQKPSSDPQQGHASYSFAVGEQKQEQATTQRRRSKNTLVCFAVSLLAFFIVLILMLSLTTREVIDENCPDHNPALSSWNPGHDQQKTVIIRKGDLFRLESSATVHSIIIQRGGVLVFADDTEGFKNITLRTRYILIEDGGVLHIGAAKCRYRSKATITLFGRRDEGEEVPGFGRKFIGVRAGGSLELHGTEKLSWTFLSRTLPSSGLAAGGYSFERNFSRGINLRVLDQDTAEVLVVDRFDTHESKNDSRRLHEFLKSLHPGRIVSLAVGDSAVKSLLDETKRIIADLLGSTFVYNLKYRQAWALVGVIGGGNASCSEDVREHENHDTGGQAVARREFITVDGVRFSVSAYSEWREGFPISGFQVEVVDGVMLHMKDDVQSWNPGDRVIIASTDFSMYQAEEFSLLPCPECNKYQVKIQGKPQFTHVGEIIDAIDMRAEVGVLTRNILIHGEMENSCYGNNWCQFFSYDTFGGHIKILGNFTSVHLSHIELKNMGQQVKGSYPVHFHLCGDVDERGGYRTPTYLEGLAIHHSFSRCVAVHATNGLLDTGIWYLFHSMSTGDTHGLSPETKAELTPLGIFYNNRVHSNFKAGLFIDKGVKTTNASAADPREYLCLDNNARKLNFTYIDSSTMAVYEVRMRKMRIKAGLFIDKGVKTTNASAADPREYLCLDNNARKLNFTYVDSSTMAVYEVRMRKMRIKAGLFIDKGVKTTNASAADPREYLCLDNNARFADNGIGLSFASDGSFPKDVGSSQEVSESLFVGESKNYGTNGGQNKYWGVGGGENKTRTLPRNKTFPIRGFQIYDGPVHLTKSTFKHFIPTSDRYTSAVGFFLKNPWQLTPRNNISSVKFETSVSLKVFFGISGPWFEENELDGDKNSIFHDVDGSVTGYKDAYVGRMDNFLIRHPDCINVTKWNGVICSGRYSQVFIQTWGSQNLSMSIVRDEYPSTPMTLRGINSQRAAFQQYQPVVMIGKSYTVHWNGSAPKETVLYLINFDKSIVLLSTRNKQSGFGSISQYLVSLGIAKAADLQIKESFAFFGFQGGVNTSWAKLFTAPAGKKLGLLEKYIPLELEEYGCTKADTPWRKDVELLKKALSKH